jgi:hypothetical protein
MSYLCLIFIFAVPDAALPPRFLDRLLWFVSPAAIEFIIAVPAPRAGYFRYGESNQSHSPLLTHPIPKRYALWYGVRRRGKMVLVTFAVTKVTRARGETRIKNNIAEGDAYLRTHSSMTIRASART